MLAAIDFKGLGQVVWVSAVAIFSLGKAGEARRSGQGGASAAFGALAVVALLVFVGSVLLGVTVMLRKG